MGIDWGAGLISAALFLGIPSIFLIFFAQWKWAKTCDKNIQVLVAKRSGGGRYQLSPESGGEITLVNPDTKEERTWPINELATINIPYPGVGFVPKFLQKSIRLAIVNEGDWEPMLNRGHRRKRVASADVIEFIQSIAEKSSKKDVRENIEAFLEEVSPDSSRELIADPAILGALKQNTIMKALASVSDELIDSIKVLKTQLSRIAGINPTIIYVGLFVIGALTIFITIQVMQMNLGDTVDKIDQIYNSLGIGQ